MKNVVFAAALLILFAYLGGCISTEKNTPGSQPIVPPEKTGENIQPNSGNGVPIKEQQQVNQGPVKIENAEKSGTLERDEIWGGEILVTEDIIIPKEVTLTIEPGTKVKFKHSRDYKNPGKVGMQIFGTLKAVGTPEKQIWFTSDAADPVNGDWRMMRFMDAGSGSEIKYSIVEFAQQGINMWNSSPIISHTIVRWNNWEGVYLESYSKPLIEFNRIYQNGYNGIAMEQFNDAIVRNNYVGKSGTNGIHVDASNALLENNVIEENANGLSVDDAGTLTARNNALINNRAAGIDCGEGANKLSAIGNYFEGNNSEVECPEEMIIENKNGTGKVQLEFDYPDTKTFDLGYTPSDPKKDKYLYVYPDDETRKIVKKIGEGLGLTWSVAWDGNYVWAAALWGDLYKFDPETGNELEHFKVPLQQAWGMTFDGQNLWITDFAEKKTYEINPENGEVVSSFLNPDQQGGAKGIAWDGEYLYLMGWTSPVIYKVDRKGGLIEKIELEQGGGGIAFDGENFWIPGCKGICKFSKDGKLIGEIYAASEGTWDLSWDAKHNWLWATQRTNENWQDAKIFALQILDDSLK